MAKPLVYLTRVEKFSSAHRLNNRNCDEEFNRKTFDKCNNIHGHNYTLEVTIKGEIDPVTGMVMNVGDLKTIIDQYVLRLLDHKYLDEDVDHFRTQPVPSTSENICVFIWNQLQPRMPDNVRLHGVKLFETDKNIVQFFG